MASKIFLLFLLFLGATSRLAASFEGQEDVALNQGSVFDDSDDSAVIGVRKKRATKRCGPDISSWLVSQMNANRNHRHIKNCRNSLIPANPVCLYRFANLVGSCKVWDFKCTQTFRRGACPKQCPRTVTLCGRCVNYDVPGNIHYGWVGRAAKISRRLLLYAADRVQKGGVDDPKDKKAIIIGMNLWDDTSRRSRFCQEVVTNIASLNLQGTSGCSKCTTRY